MKPFQTPLPLKVLILTTVGLTLLSPFLSPYLSLSLYGIFSLHLWQFFSYPFVEALPFGFSLLLSLTLNMYLLWVFGASLIERIRTLPFFILYFSSILVGGLSAYGILHLLEIHSPYSGPTTPLFAVLTAWTMLHPDAQLLLFFAIPMRARGLLFTFLGAILLMDFFALQWVYLFSYLATFVYSYLFTLFAFRAKGLFPRLDHYLLDWTEKKASKPKTESFRSENPDSQDDAFMDAMLEKISLHGESSLTSKEKARMQEISEKKKRKF